MTTFDNDRVVLNVPQINAVEGRCSDASIQMVLQYYGFYYPSLEEIGPKIKDYIWGATPFLSNYLRTTGYGPGMVGELYTSLDNEHPVFMRIKPSGQEGGHTVVLVGYDKTKDLFYVNDPAFHRARYSYRTQDLLDEWEAARRGSIFIQGTVKEPDFTSNLPKSDICISDSRVINKKEVRIMEKGVVFKRWSSGAVMPDDTAPAGFIWFRGTVENNLPFPIFGVVGISARQNEKTAGGRQRVTLGGNLLKLKDPTTEFDMRVDVADMGKIDSTWDVTMFTGNLGGKVLITETKEGNIRVSSIETKPEAPEGGFFTPSKTTG